MLQRHGFGFGQRDLTVLVGIGHDDHPPAEPAAMMLHDETADLLAIFGRAFLELLTPHNAPLDPLFAGFGELVAADRAVLVAVEPVKGDIRVAKPLMVD